MAIFPWNSFGEQGSPFVLIFDGLGIPAAATILNIIVISASISAINSDIFGAGRMMYGMSKEGLAPKSFQRIASNGVPLDDGGGHGRRAAGGGGIELSDPRAGICANCFAGGIRHGMGVADDSAIPFCHAPRFVCRRAQPGIAFPIPFWPVAPLLTLLFMGLVIAVLGMFAETRMALIAGLGLARAADGGVVCAGA